MVDRQGMWRGFMVGMGLYAAGCGGGGASPAAEQPGSTTNPASMGAGGTPPGLVGVYVPPTTSGAAGMLSGTPSGPTRPWWAAGNGAATPPGNGFPPPGTGTGTGTDPIAGTTAPPPVAGGTTAPPPTPPAAGASAPTASAGTTGSGTPGNNVAGLPDAELEALRQLCVDEINMYRASVPALMLKPMKRATPEQEACADRGAQMDGDSGMAHGAARAGLCRSVGLSAENTCPGWGVGGFSGNATVADALKRCLKAMWDEGEPPVSRQMCQQDYAGCFLAHGHYLNMSETTLGTVACSFYKMKDGKYWMNQDFAR